MTLRRLETRHGPMLALAGDQFITRCLEAHGEFSPDELNVLSQMVRPGATVVEAGANIGVHTVPLARLCAPGTLYAFEPQPVVFDALQANLSLNGLANVVARQEACGAAEGEATIPPLDYDGPGNFGGLSLGPAGGAGVRVRVAPIDGLSLNECALLKIDVEGFEAEVLHGAAATIARLRPRIYVENDRRERQQELISLLDEMGYRLFWHLPPMIADEVQPNVLGRRVVSVNMLCLPKESRTHVDGLRLIDPADWRHPLNRPRA